MFKKIGEIRLGLLVAGISVIALGCAKVAPDNPVFRDYLILGEVNHPGAYEFDGIEQSLLTLIDRAEGMAELAIARRVRVERSGITNYYNLLKIKSGALEDPLIPLGSVVRVRRGSM
jgi:protein involved in polysaccharide export with SLBB domain